MYKLKEIEVCIDYDLEVSVRFERQGPDGKWHGEVWTPTPTSWKRLIDILDRTYLDDKLFSKVQFDPMSMFVYIDVT